ncbi:ATP-binding cassette domain-containing protein [Halobacillus litoralis]|uniref:ATP-binding cassette domain-containing protein n=1 Tax=Halobacillus litoralis TaxID=45668 RepID=A0A845DTP6_9BACI|nr:MULTISPECIES: ABC transporter ATP-binding protein [Halobacillus]MCA1021304.1 ABC transporter ATP-binding protein [Halobacillus litoralis]MYL20993.1 ATP-binding cassette domain-containing protein [Halobacillus litoralis]MYL31468.1 ATP-binding cassette domain-containing protein [Halobacillus halophilus]MYL38377.1 ATP-binding cassette domain-containing protein [Halobacillus litoralis]
MDTLLANNLTLGYGDSVIIDSLDVKIPKGKVTVLIGGNGCGKSTLLRSMARLLKPKSGQVVLDQKDISKMRTKDVAKKMAILPQSPTTPEGLTVYQLVKQGRYPYQGFAKRWSDEDEEAVTRALNDTNLMELKDRSVDSLSGGQRQRAWIAMTLAQDTDTLLLDEPTTYLDMTHQIEILDLLFDLNQDNGRTIVMVLHDINLACRYADHIIAVKDKTVYTQGRPEDVVTCDMMHHVFEMVCDVREDPLFGTPMCIPHGKGRCLIKQAQADAQKQTV